MNNDTNKLRQSLSANSGQLNDDGLFAKCVSAAARANQGATTANDAIQRIAYMAPVTKQAPVHAVILHDNQKVKIKVVCVGKNAYIQTNPSTRDAGVAIRDREILGPEKAQYLLPKIDEYAHMHKLDSINIPGPVYITGIMPRIREYAYRISMETVSIKIALDQIDHIAISTTGANIGDIADKGDIANKGDAMDINDVARLIIETFTITFEEEELTQYVTKLLQACNPTIDKTYSPKLIEFVRSSVNVPSDRPACGTCYF